MGKEKLFIIMLSIWINIKGTLQSSPSDSSHVRTWTKWYDTDTPTSGLGDDETVASIRKRGYEVCDGHTPIDAICRLTTRQMIVFNSVNTRYVPDVLFVPCTTEGLDCRNVDQSSQCSNYQIRFQCLSPSGGAMPENLAVIGVAAGLSIIVPILCVAIMHIARLIRDHRGRRNGSRVDNTEQAVQTETSGLPPSYSFLFPDSSNPSSPSALSYRLSLTETSAEVALPNSRLSSNNLLSAVEERQNNNDNITDNNNELTSNETQRGSNWRSRFPGMHLSIFDLFTSLGQRSPTEAPQSPDFSYIQTPPPTYIDAIVIIGGQPGQNLSEDNEKQET